MSAPWIPDGTAATIAAPVLGFCFGFLLERAGLTHAPKLAAMFYGRDFTVLRVLMSAIVTAMLGAFWLDRAGVLALPAVYVPETLVVPQLIGAALFGIGFVLAGLCPGTACGALATGRTEGALVVLGIFAGVAAYLLAYPAAASLAEATPRGSITIPDATGLPAGVIIAGIVALALAAFALAGRIERAVS